MNGRNWKNKVFRTLAPIVLSVLIFNVISCDDTQADLIAGIPGIWTGGNCSISFRGPVETKARITESRMCFVLPYGTYSWEITDSDWESGPVADGTVVLTEKHHELMIREPELSRVILEIESDLSFETEIVTASKSERAIGEERKVSLIGGKTTRVFYRDLPEGLFNVTMTDETGSPMPMLSFDIVRGRDNVFTLTYRALENPEQKEDVTLKISSPRSMDTEVLWRSDRNSIFTPVPVRLLSGSTTELTLEKVPVGKTWFAVKNWDGSMGEVKSFTVTEGVNNTFRLRAGLSEEDDRVTKVTVRLVSDEEVGATICFMGEGMTAPRRHPVHLTVYDKIFLLDWNREGLLSVWIEKNDGSEEARTEMYVSKGHVNTVTLRHHRPYVPEEENREPEDTLPQPDPDPKPVTPPPKPVQKWGKLNLHIKCDSTGPCTLYFAYPGDKEWRTHQTKFNGIVVGRDYEFNNIPPGRFYYTFAPLGEKAFPVNHIDIKVGMNNGYMVYHIARPEAPDPTEPDTGGGTTPAPDITRPDVPETEETVKKEITGTIKIEQMGNGMMILRFVNTSDITSTSSIWYVDGKRWSSGNTMKIWSGQGTSAECWVTSPETIDPLILSTYLP